MTEAFRAGSGVDPALLKATLLTIAVGLAFGIAAWLALQVIVAHRDEQIKASEGQWAVIRVGIVCAVLVLFLSGL